MTIKCNNFFCCAATLIIFVLSSTFNLFLLPTVKCVRNKPAYFAEKLYKSMKVNEYMCVYVCMCMYVYVHVICKLFHLGL